MHESEIRIGFGTVFSDTSEEGKIEVVIELGESDYFHSATLNETKDGKKWFFHAGTTDKGHIKEILGEMTLEEVIAALDEGSRQVGFKETSQKMVEVLRKESKKKVRFIKK